MLINSEKRLFGDSVNSGKSADTGENQDIILEENNTPDISSKNSDSDKTSSDGKEHQNMENVISNLHAEKERLRELEKKYLKLQGAASESGLGKYFKPGAEKSIDSVSVAEDNNSSENTDLTGVGDSSNVVLENFPSQNLKKVRDLKKDENPEQEQKEDEYDIGVFEEANEEKPGMSNRLHQYLSDLEKEINPITIAECFYKLGEYEKALQSYKNIPQENVTSYQYIWIQYQVANCYWHLKKYDDALNGFQRFIDKNPDSELVVQAKWYIDHIAWWKEWQEKNTLDNKLLMPSDREDK